MINTENKPTNRLTTDQKNKAAEIARMMARLPEQEQVKIYYMLKGLEVFNAPRTAMTRAAATT